MEDKTEASALPLKGGKIIAAVYAFSNLPISGMNAVVSRSVAA